MPSFTVIESDWSHDAPRLSVVRRAVFIDEQGVPEALEWDEEDALAIHFLATSEHDNPIGCARLLPDGHIGRMAVIPEWRSQGVGHALLTAALHAAKVQGHTSVLLSAQTHAAGFYASEGFEIVGTEYEEAGIPHVAMRKQLD